MDNEKNMGEEQIIESTIDPQMEEVERQKRVANCTAAVQGALKEFKCDLDVSVVLRAGQVMPRVSIIPIELVKQQ